MPLNQHKNTNPSSTENCRTCVDFKTWAKQQRKSLTTTEKKEVRKEETVEQTRDDCPWDKDNLGKSTWGLLHTVAAHFPEEPSSSQQTDIKGFINILSRLYPCEFCAKDLRKELKASPPETRSQEDLSNWLCRLHNTVNVKLGKPQFDCSKVNERWRDGWLDGSCD